MPRLIFDEKDFNRAFLEYQRATPFPEYYDGFKSSPQLPKPLLVMEDTEPAIEFIRRLGWEDSVILVDNWNYPPIKVLRLPNYRYTVN